jgi:16S rRNA G966 N2-methylase RsmD
MGLGKRGRGEALYLEENAKHCVKKKERKKERQNSRRTSSLIYIDPPLLI